MRHLLYTAFIIFLPFLVSGQKKDSTTHKADTVKSKFIPTGIRLGTDLISIGKSQYVKSFTGWEVNADVEIHRYFFAVDVGSWGRKYQRDTIATNYHSAYSNTGHYFRLGVDVNFLTKDPEKNAFFIGARYGHSTYSETFEINSKIDPWGTNNEVVSNSNIHAHWFEVTTGIKVRMWKFIWMGYTARYKFGLSSSTTERLLSTDVPGFGMTNKPVTWGFNYQLYFRIPFEKAK